MFCDRRFNGTSIRKICEMAEANLALVSYYFGSKEKLYLSVIDYLYHDTEQKLAYMDNIQDAKAALHRFIDIFLHMRAQDKQFLMLLKHELSSGSSRSEAVSKTITPYFDRLRMILMKGKEDHVFRYNSLNLMLSFIASLLIFPVYDTFLLPEAVFEPQEIQQEVNDTTQFVLAGLGC